ncbi:MAG: acetyl-CoA acetyltransferase [Lautropia sp.]
MGESESRRARDVCISGVGETRYTRWGGITDRNEFQLACEAVSRAAGDAGIATRELDGLVSFADAPGDMTVLALALGIENLTFSAMVWGGRGGSACGAVALAEAAVASGKATRVAVVRSLSQGRSRRYGRSFSARTHTNFNAPFGLFSPPQMLALAVQRYDHDWGLDRDALMEVALVCNAHAQSNPRAVMYGRALTAERYRASRPIAEPLRLHDCCLETDGACALVVTTARRARDAGAKPVPILAASQYGAKGWSTAYMGSQNVPSAEYGTGGQRELARRLYQQAGLTPAGIEVLQVYDHFTGMVPIALEEFGFCEPGQGGRYIRAGEIGMGGRTPMNTAGGSLAEAYVHGLNHVVEGVRQMRGESVNQVAGARTCLVTSGAGIMPTSGLILGVA